MQFQIIRALGWIKSYKAVPALEKFLKHKDRTRRDAAMFALEAITGKDYGSKEQLKRPPAESLEDLLRDLPGSASAGKNERSDGPALDVGKAYRFVFSRADIKDLEGALLERPRDGWAKIQPRSGETACWIHLSTVVMVVPASEKK